MSKVKWEKPVDAWSEYFAENEEAENQYQEYETKRYKAPMFINGPSGMVPINKNCHPGKLFNVWVGHTNFLLTPSVIQSIDAVPGVEMVDCLTKYRFKIAVGQLFDDKEVRKKIGEKIHNTLSSNVNIDGVIGLLRKSNHKFWAVIVIGSRCEYIVGESRLFVESASAKFTGIAQQVVYSWDDEQYQTANSNQHGQTEKI